MLWREKRPVAPDLFIDELDAALGFLTRQPRGGKAYPTPVHPNLRRHIMMRTRYHLYYEYLIEEDLVWVHDVWSAVRGEGPPLL